MDRHALNPLHHEFRGSCGVLPLHLSRIAMNPIADPIRCALCLPVDSIHANCSVACPRPDGSRNSNAFQIHERRGAQPALSTNVIMRTTPLHQQVSSSAHQQVSSAIRRRSRCSATRSRPRAGPRAPCVYQKPSACALASNVL